MSQQIPVIKSSRILAAHREPGRLVSVKYLLRISLFGFVVLMVGIIAAFSQETPMFIGAMFVLLVLLPLIWHRPVLGLYLLFGGAVVFESFNSGFPDSFIDQVPFIQSFSASGGPSFLLVTGAELVLFTALAAVALRRMSVGLKPLIAGQLFWAVAVYAVVVGFGLVHGLGTGGNLEAALWEVRAQGYLFLAYLLVVNTIHDRSQVTRLMWIFMLGVSLKGIVGVWRWLVTLGGDLGRLAELSNTNSILPHEESQIFALFLAFILVLFFFRSNRGQLGLGLLAATPVLLAFLANERRAGTLALMVAIVVVTALAFVMLKYRRKLILRIGILIVIASPIVLAVTWNSEGILAEPARAVKSLVDPDQRDASSNNYREIESLNLKYNIQTNPILGRGFGHPISLFIWAPNAIPYDFIWWDIIPHNTILWVWMRLGLIGFIAFWFMVGRSLVGALLITKQLSIPYLKSVGVFAVVALVTWVGIGALDMGIVDPRFTIMIGSLIGLVSNLPQIEQREIDGATGSDSSVP